jgi:tetratricopeptide (TPR) repeat protein
MQKRFSLFEMRVIILSILPFLCNFESKAQTQIPDLERYRAKLDSTYILARQICNSDSTGKIAKNWLTLSNAFAAVMDESELKEKYQQVDFHIETSKILKQALKLDKSGEYLPVIQSALASNTMDLSNIALASMETARKYKSEPDAIKAIELFALCLEDYKETGNSQRSVDSYWKEEDLDWKWIRFYKAVSMRMAKKVPEAEKEYQTLVKLGWNVPVLFLELANLQLETAKVEDATKTLILGNELNPNDPKIACQLSKIFLETDRLKKAQELMKNFTNLRSENIEVALTTALIYEKKGDYKKADAFFKALYKSDPNEVEINKTYAGYLMRKASNADKMDAQELAQQAYNLLATTVDLSPHNVEIKQEWQGIKTKFPKVYKLDESN